MTHASQILHSCGYITTDVNRWGAVCFLEELWGCQEATAACLSGRCDKKKGSVPSNRKTVSWTQRGQEAAAQNGRAQAPPQHWASVRPNA